MSSLVESADVCRSVGGREEQMWAREEAKWGFGKNLGDSLGGEEQGAVGVVVKGPLEVGCSEAVTWRDKNERARVTLSEPRVVVSSEWSWVGGGALASRWLEV